MSENTGDGYTIGTDLTVGMEQNSSNGRTSWWTDLSDIYFSVTPGPSYWDRWVHPNAGPTVSPQWLAQSNPAPVVIHGNRGGSNDGIPEQSSPFSITVDLVGLGLDLTDVLRAAAITVPQAISLGLGTVLLLHDIGQMLNEPSPLQVASWTSFNLSGIAPGAVYVASQNGVSWFDLSLNQIEGNVPFQVSWSQEIGGPVVDFF